jgi:hypothetical protein
MTMFPEIESELHRKEILQEVESIRLEKEATKGKTLLDKNLALLGRLMIAGGEKLRRRHQALQEAGSAQLSKSQI